MVTLVSFEIKASLFTFLNTTIFSNDAIAQEYKLKELFAAS